MSATEDLMIAVQSGDADAAGLALRRGADIHYDEDYPLRAAAILGKTEVLRLLLDRGADVQAIGGAPLFLAVVCRHLDATRLLIERGARPNPQTLLAARHQGGAMAALLESKKKVT